MLPRVRCELLSRRGARCGSSARRLSRNSPCRSRPFSAWTRPTLTPRVSAGPRTSWPLQAPDGPASRHARNLQQLAVVGSCGRAGRRRATRLWPRRRRARNRFGSFFSVAWNSVSACAGSFISSSISPSSSRAGAIGPGVTAFFSVASSRTAAARIVASASAVLPSARARKAARAVVLNRHLLGPVRLIGLREPIVDLLQRRDRTPRVGERLRCATRRARARSASSLRRTGTGSAWARGGPRPSSHDARAPIARESRRARRRQPSPGPRPRRRSDRSRRRFRERATAAPAAALSCPVWR